MLHELSPLGPSGEEGCRNCIFPFDSLKNPTKPVDHLLLRALVVLAVLGVEAIPSSMGWVVVIIPSGGSELSCPFAHRDWDVLQLLEFV